MGAVRGSAQPQLVVDPPTWAHEEVPADAVLAQFADESALGGADAGDAGQAQTPTQSGGARQRMAWDRQRLADAMRTAIVACLTAVALGASFAIGFGYVWSDRAPVASPARPELAAEPPRVPRPIWWMPLPPPVKSAVKPSDAPSATDATARREETRQAGLRSSDRRAVQTSTRTRGSATAAAPAATAPLVSTRSVEVGAAQPEPATGDIVPAATHDVVAAPVPAPAPVLDSRGLGAVSDASSILDTARPVLVPPASTGMVGVSRESGSAARTAPNRADIDAVRHTIALYQSAYSQMDVGAIAAVWPTVDMAGVERAFAGVERQALLLNECRVTTAGPLATAVCPGQVRYVGRVGGRQIQERQGTWTIALERRDDAWQVVRLNVREGAPAVRTLPSPKP